jgi:hypothetical protein
MNTNQFSASALIEAPVQVVYAVIADYHRGHAGILPKPPFVSIDVEQGGIGEGTVIRVCMKVLGKRQSFQSVVTEPDPGRKLVETNDNGYVTTFTVEPYSGGRNAYVTISTVMTGRSGWLGKLEYWFVKRLLHPVYFRELNLLRDAVLK